MDTKLDRKLYIALKEAVCQTFNYEDWVGVGILTGTEVWIDEHPRLLRSMRFGDDDYGACVFKFIDKLSQSGELESLIHYSPVEEWLRSNQPVLYYRHCHQVTPLTLALNVQSYIDRLHSAMERRDGPLIVGTAKEMLEGLFKAILERHGELSTPQDLLALWREVRGKLDLRVEGVESDRLGAEPLRKLLAGLNAIVHSVSELRNLYGTGHGRSDAPELDFASTVLVADSASALAKYLDSRYQGLSMSVSLALTSKVGQEA